MNGSNPTFDDIAVRDRTPAAIRADNLIRQRLRIGDPRDPREVAEGLKRLFPKDAGLLAAEAEGFAVVPYRSRTMPRVPESHGDRGRAEPSHRRYRPRPRSR